MPPFYAKFLPKILIFQEPLIIETWNLCHWIWHAWTLNMYHSSHFNAFSQSKSTKCEIFGWNFDFSGTTYHRNCETCAIGFGMPWTLNMHHSSHFNAFYPVKINKMWNFCLKFWVCWSQCTMLELLCDKYFLSYDDFSWFLTGRFRHRVLKHGVGIEWDPRRTAA